ncbi:MAG: alpha/beta hydrolase [Candidatus Muiribacteriota bacterium]
MDNFFPIIKNILIVLILFFTFILVFFRFFQNKLIFFPVKSLSITPKNYNLDFENIIIKTDNNFIVRGWFIPGDKNRETILFNYGNGGNMSYHIDRAAFYNKLGFNSLFFDYPGYGKTEGKLTENNLYSSAENCYNYLINEKEIQESDIIIWGWSLGCAPAAKLASKNNPKALIVESGFTQIKEIGGYHYPFLPIKQMARYYFPTVDFIKKVDIPMLFIHSADDEIIPFFMGKKLFEEAEGDKKFVTINGSHNDSFFVSKSIIENNLSLFLENFF